MAIKTKIYARGSLASTLAPLLALGMLCSAGSVASGQNSPPPAAMPPGATTGPATPPTNDRPMSDRDDITRRDIAEMDHFLDEHPEIAQQLRKDPSLIDNRKWVSDHPALQEYLQNHPQISATFRANPNLFMRDEERYDRETSDRNISRRDIVDMDRFLDAHPEIAEQLKKDPSLIDNRQWVANHPALQEYLKTHIDVSAAFRAHPDQFMRDEDRYDQNGDHFGGNRTSADDRNRGELTGFGQFLGGHTTIAAELSSDPTLATNKEYLANHPELNEYLQAHPTVSQQLSADPQGVMSSTTVQGGFHAQPVGPTPRPKSPSNQ
ncbi:MAG TPA: hypothetical protein VIH78_07395 [Terriglobales bacterium]